jgi:polyhydroxyalkanoate synthesis regulator phasin
MDKDVIDDLKQFITTTISQQLADVASKDDIADLKGDIARLDKKVDGLQAQVSDAIDASNEATDAQLKDHEQRITRLEQATA